MQVRASLRFETLAGLSAAGGNSQPGYGTSRQPSEVTSIPVKPR
jgi:hypothetical protein